MPQALENTQNIVGKLDEKSMTKLLSEVAAIRSPGAAKLHRVLENIQDLSRTLNDSYPQIQNLIEASKTITGTLASKDDKLREIIDSSQVLLQSLVNRRNELAATIGQGSRTVRTLDNVISRNQKKLDALLDNLHLLTTRLAPNMDALNTDFSLLGPTFQQVANLKGNGPWIEGVLTGLLVEQTPAQVTLLDAKGERVTVPREKVQTVKQSPVSLMPEGLLSGMKPQQLRDLFAYLQSNGR